MNLVQLITLVAIVACGRSCARILGARYGPIGGAIGFVVGCLVAVGIYLLLRPLYWAHKGYPLCKNGKCRSKDYTFIGGQLDLINKVRGGYLRCSCGTTYLLEIEPRRLLEVCEDGKIRPYMVQRGYKYHWFPIWEPDEGRTPEDAERADGQPLQ